MTKQKQEKQKKSSPTIKKSPLDMFFKLGDLATKGDPKRKADFDYCMLWIIFGAFTSIFIGNIWAFFQTYELAKLGWACFGLAIMWFQYNNLKAVREMRKMQAQQPQQPKKPEVIETVDEMLKEFKKK